MGRVLDKKWKAAFPADILREARKLVALAHETTVSELENECMDSFPVHDVAKRLMVLLRPGEAKRLKRVCHPWPRDESANCGAREVDSDDD